MLHQSQLQTKEILQSKTQKQVYTGTTERNKSTIQSNGDKQKTLKYQQTNNHSHIGHIDNKAYPSAYSSTINISSRMVSHFTSSSIFTIGKHATTNRQSVAGVSKQGSHGARWSSRQNKGIVNSIEIDACESQLSSPLFPRIIGHL